MKVLSGLPDQGSDRLLVGGGPDDAGVYEMEDGRLMIQTVDFFTPIVDDPGAYGRIAAANSMSDVYAMGATPQTALNITGVPLEEVGIDRLREILRASQETVSSAGGVVMGGHTVKSPEPIFGLSVTGFVGKDQLVTNDAARPGDHLFLTKPLGTGILTTAHKKTAVSEEQWLREGIDWMTRLNDVGHELAEGGLISTMTDITGYGFLGHAYEMLGAECGMEINFGDLPILNGIPELVEAGHVPGGTKDNWASVKDRVSLDPDNDAARWILADAQTSGGLLVATPEETRRDVKEILRDHDLCHRQIGRITDDPAVVINS